MPISIFPKKYMCTYRRKGSLITGFFTFRATTFARAKAKAKRFCEVSDYRYEGVSLLNNR
jgi:hypothetical protein